MRRLVTRVGQDTHGMPGAVGLARGRLCVCVCVCVRARACGGWEVAGIVQSHP